MAMVEDLMMDYTVEMISIEKVVASVKRFSTFSASKELPYDLEDAMVFWVNKVSTGALPEVGERPEAPVVPRGCGSFLPESITFLCVLLRRDPAGGPGDCLLWFRRTGPSCVCRRKGEGLRSAVLCWCSRFVNSCCFYLRHPVCVHGDLSFRRCFDEEESVSS